MSSPNTLLNLSGFQDGIAADETGINIEEFKATVEPEFRNVIPGKYGAARGVVLGPAKLNVALRGEVSSALGIMAAVFGTATTIANTTAYAGAPTTGKYLTKFEVTEARENGKLKEVSAEFEALAGVS